MGGGINPGPENEVHGKASVMLDDVSSKSKGTNTFNKWFENAFLVAAAFTVVEAASLFKSCNKDKQQHPTEQVHKAKIVHSPVHK